MYEIVIEEHFAASHRLIGYQGDCEKLHGHNWVVRVCAEVEDLNPIGLGIDFRTLKGITREFVTLLDHTHLNEHPAFQETNPSSENLARFLFDKIGESLLEAEDASRLAWVEVWETPTAVARYCPSKTSV